MKMMRDLSARQRQEYMRRLWRIKPWPPEQSFWDYVYNLFSFDKPKWAVAWKKHKENLF